MPETARPFDELVQEFEALVGATVRGAYESRPFILLLCGPRSMLNQSLTALPKEHPDDPLIARWNEAFAKLETRLKATAMPAAFKGPRDGTAAHRGEALCQLVRSQLVETSCEEFPRRLKAAKAAFDALLGQVQGRVSLLAPDVADSSTAQAADEGLFARVDEALTPWTVGSWMVWDVLSGWSSPAPPLATEATPVLFAEGEHSQALRLVVEALPGPLGLVTPHWGRLGLCAFDTTDQNELLLPAIHRMLRLGLSRLEGVRLRWYLDVDDWEAWKYGLAGHSVEAAAAVAALALVEQVQERRRLGEGRPVPPILDAKTAVTAVVGDGAVDGFLDWKLGHVNPDTLAAKLGAAQRLGIDVVAVAEGQPILGGAVPGNLRLDPLPTVGEAFDRLRAVSRALDVYGNYLRSQFRYHEEDSPPTT